MKGRNDFGSLLSRWREQRLLSQRELAKLAGVSRITILRAEGGGQPTYETCRKILRALQIDHDQYMKGPS